MKSKIYFQVAVCLCTLLCFATKVQATIDTIIVTSNVFTPNSLTITSGDTVTWINMGGTHNVNGTQATFPSNPASFGNAVGAGWTYSNVFTVPGNYDFRCDPHFSFGMTGVLTVLAVPPPVADSIFINEIHYDNAGIDSLEGVEIFGPAGTDLSCYDLVFYNGGTSNTYKTVSLSGTIDDEGCGYGAVWFAITSIQNGNPDAVALVETCNCSGSCDNDDVVQFLSYGGTVTAGNGVAVNMISVDIGVSEPGADGTSLQLTGPGTTYSALTWVGPITATADDLNVGQISCSADTIISFVGSNIMVAEDVGTFTIELSIVNPSPSTAFTVDVVYSTGSATNVADFTFSTQTITFPANDSTNKTATITIIDDTIMENSEDIVLILQNASAGVILGSDSIFTVTIIGNDALTPCSDLFFSEYVEGTSFNKALEVYNPRTDSVDLSNYTFLKRTNGTGTINSYTYSGMLAPDSVFVLVNSSGDSLLKLLADTITGGLMAFSGNDPMILVNTFSGDTIDKFGEWGVDPGTNWPVGTGATSEFTLVRKISVKNGNLYWIDGVNEWDVYPQNDWTHLGSHSMTACAVASATANFSNNSPICLGDSVCFTDLSTAGGGAIISWVWDFGDGAGTSTSQNPCYTYFTDGSYNVKLVVTDDSSLVDSTTIVVNVNLPATATAGVNDTICAGDAVNVTGTIGGSATASVWTTGGDGAFDNDSALSASYTPGSADIAAGTVKLFLATDSPAGVCGAAMDSLILVINQAATAAAGVDQSICLGDPVTVNGATGGSATSSIWITMGDGSFADSSLLVTTYTTGPTDNGMGSVTIVLVSNDPTGPCPSVTDTMVVTINAPAVVSAGPDQTICADMSCVSLAGTVTGITSTGVWSSTGGGAFSPSTTDLSACYTPDATDTTAGSVTIILTSTNNGACAAVADTAILSINSVPTIVVSAIVIDSSSCGNSDGDITGITASGVATLTYSWVNSVPSVVGTALDLTLIPSDCYTLSVIGGNGCVSSTGPHCVIDAGTPGIPTPDGAPTYCTGDAIADLTATGSGGTLYWFNDALLTDTAGTGSPFVSGATSTDTFYVAELGACLGLAAQVIITVDPVATVNAGADISVCGTSANLLAGSIGGAATSSIWTTMGDGTFDDSSLVAASYTPGSADVTAGTVMLILTSDDPAGPCGAVSDTLMLTVQEASVVDAGSDQTFCMDIACVTLNGSVSGGTTTGIWTSMGTGTMPNDSDLTGCYTVGASDVVAGFVVMVLTSTNNGLCPAVMDSVTITIVPAAIVDAGPDQSLCDSSCVALSASVGGSTTTGQWVSIMGSGTFVPSDSDLAACYAPSSADLTAGSVTLVITSTNNGSCAAMSDTVIITFNQSATVSAGADVTQCGSSPVTLSGSIGGGASTSTWSTSGDGTFDDASLAAAVYTAGTADVTAGTVTLTLTTDDPTGACLAASDDLVLTISPAPVAAFVSTVTNFTALFVDNSTVSTGSITGWSWTFGDGNTDIVSGPSNTYSANGTYNVCLTVTSSSGCTDIFCDSVTVMGVGISEIDLGQFIEIYPNPSSDGMINIQVSDDIFRGSPLGVYNLYGQLITETTINERGVETLDLSKQGAGIYMINIITEKGTVTRRITIF